MLNPTFPAGAALTLSKEGEGGDRSRRVEAALDLLSHAAGLILSPSPADGDDGDEEGDDVPAPDGAGKATRRARGKKKDDVKFSAKDPKVVLEALASHAKATVRRGLEPAGEDAVKVSPRVLAECCLAILKDDLLS
jgi:hypothetical protein